MACLEPQPITGKTPADALPPIRFKAAMTNGTQLQLAVRGGPNLTDAWPLEDIDQGPGPRNLTDFVDALVGIQRHTAARVTIPDINSGGHAFGMEYILPARTRILTGQESTEPGAVPGDGEGVRWARSP